MHRRRQFSGRPENGKHGNRRRRRTARGGSSNPPLKDGSQCPSERVHVHGTVREGGRAEAGGGGSRCKSSTTAALLVALVGSLTPNGALAQQVGNLTGDRDFVERPKVALRVGRGVPKKYGNFSALHWRLPPLSSCPSSRLHGTYCCTEGS